MIISEENLRKRLGVWNESIERCNKKIEEKKIPYEKQDILRHDQSKNYFTKAVYSSLLGLDEDYKELFRRSASFYHESFMINPKRFQERASTEFLEMLERGILSDDKEIIKKIVAMWGNARRVYESQGNPIYNYLASIADLFIALYEKSDIKEKIAELEKRSALNKKGTKFFSLSPLTEAVIEKDEDKFAKHLPQLIKEHDTARKGIVGYSKDSSDVIICPKALVMIKFATERGMKINLDNLDEQLKDYLPDKLLEIVMK